MPSPSVQTADPLPSVWTEIPKTKLLQMARVYIFHDDKISVGTCVEILSEILRNLSLQAMVGDSMKERMLSI